MTTEQKAKAYDELLIKAKQIYNKENDVLIMHTIEDLFPELAESEDERIRKELIKVFSNREKYLIDQSFGDITVSEALTWLEKQGEHANFRNKIQIGDKVTRNEDGVLVNLSQLKRVAKKHEKQGEQKSQRMISAEAKEAMYGKTADKVEPKFKVGDWVTNGRYAKLIVGINSDWPFYMFKDGTSERIKDIDKKYHLWTIKDAKPGDVLYSDCLRLLWIFKGRDTVYCGCNLNYNDGAFCVEGYINTPTDAIPATKEQRDTLFAKMKDAGYEWDSEKKELKKIELSDVGHEYYSELLKNDTSDNIADYAYQCVYCMSHDWAIENPTWDNVQSACMLGAKWQKKHDVSEDWSEEDEKMIGRVRGIIEAYAFSQSAVDVNGDLCEKKFIDVDIWLKSIKERYTWKPSDEQIEALDFAADCIVPAEFCFKRKELKGLLEQLKKLKGH